MKCNMNVMCYCTKCVTLVEQYAVQIYCFSSDTVAWYIDFTASDIMIWWDNIVIRDVKTVQFSEPVC